MANQSYSQIPTPNVAQLKHDLDKAFHNHTSNSDLLQLVLSRHGKQVWDVTGGQVPVFLIPALIPDQWFDYYAKSLIMTRKSGKREAIEIDNSGVYTYYFATEREPSSLVAITRTTTYKVVLDEPPGGRATTTTTDLETMMVMAWENYNWYATGLLTVKPEFKHAIKRTWAATPHHAYQAFLDRSGAAKASGAAVRDVDEAAIMAMRLGLSREMANSILYKSLS